MKKVLLILLFVALPSALFAEPAADRPYWSLELKGGKFIPDIDNWANSYGRRDTYEYGGALAYKVFRRLEVGVEGMFARDSGHGLAPLHNMVTGDLDYRVVPLDVFVLARGIFTEGQWIVPYAGGGWTRIFYREEVKDQGVVRGAVNGYHARAGIQLLLDQLDPDAANNFFMDYGVFHSYLFLEARYTRAMVDTLDTPSRSINLGGTSWLGGLLFEF